MAGPEGCCRAVRRQGVLYVRVGSVEVSDRAATSSWDGLETKDAHATRTAGMCSICRFLRASRPLPCPSSIRARGRRRLAPECGVPSIMALPPLPLLVLPRLPSSGSASILPRPLDPVRVVPRPSELASLCASKCASRALPSHSKCHKRRRARRFCHKRRRARRLAKARRCMNHGMRSRRASRVGKQLDARAEHTVVDPSHMHMLCIHMYEQGRALLPDPSSFASGWIDGVIRIIISSSPHGH